jgi:hypothetical protein
MLREVFEGRWVEWVKEYLARVDIVKEKS